MTKIESTGLLKKTLPNDLYSLVYPPKEVAERIEECRRYAAIEKAHVLMLSQCELVPEESVCGHLLKIVKLESEQFLPLLQKETPRGFYMAWEGHLQSDEKSCFAHLGRSRNDINATLARLRLRMPVVEIMQTGLSIVTDMIAIGRLHSGSTMAGHTHNQPAMPLTLGHQFLAWAFAISRELAYLLDALEGSEEECPMGAGAQGGTNLRIRPEYTASLLGFKGCGSNSLDSVANRSFLIHTLAAASGLGLIVNRICQDIMFYTSPEVGYINLADELCGASSMMPQKRNPYLCEVISGKMIHCSGALNSVAVMLRTPYTNTAVAGEALEETVEALEKVRSGLILFAAIINGIRPNTKRMQEVAVNYHTCATLLANFLVTNAKYSFREAHRLVGGWIRTAERSDKSFIETAIAECEQLGIPLDPGVLLPEEAVKSAEYGGGPGPRSLEKQKELLQVKYRKLEESLNAHLTRWNRASESLAKAVSRVCR